MSLAAYKAVWKMDLSGAKKLVMLALADFANDSGECWPSYDTLHEMTGSSTRHLKRITKELSDEGHLQVAQHTGRGNSNHYIIHLKGDTTSPIDTKERVTFETLKGDICDIKGDTTSVKGDTTSPEPYRTVKNQEEEAQPLQILHRDLALKASAIVGYDKIYLTPNAITQLNDFTEWLTEATATIKDLEYFEDSYWWGKTRPSIGQVKKYWPAAMAQKASPPAAKKTPPSTAPKLNDKLLEAYNRMELENV